MQALSYSAVRRHFVMTMEHVCDDHEPVIITRKSARPVVMLSLEDFNAIQETGYLLKSPVNAARLRESIKQYEKGKAKVHKLLDD